MRFDTNRRLPELDGLRAMAVSCVMAFHFIPWVDRYAPLGSIGVRVFFVISGFLITRILLASRGLPIGRALGRFYIRRGLRIFPLFYLVLALAAAINIGPVRQTIGWHAAYLSNAYLFDRGSWHGSISHLWSLAVEEQFYLLWPLLILLWPERRLPALVVTMIVAAPISRILIGGPMNSVLPTSCLDSLGAGALLALPQTRPAAMKLGLWIGAPLVIVALALRYAGFSSVPFEVALDFGVAMTAAWLVGTAAEGFRGLGGTVLQLKPIAYLGSISYGVYLFHGFMPYVLGRVVPGFIDLSWPIRFMLLTASTLAIASLSWRWFESPILALKEKWAGDARIAHRRRAA